MMVETGVLTGESGAYRLGAAPPSVEVPATVRAVLGARLDRLAPQEKRVLQHARLALEVTRKLRERGTRPTPSGPAPTA